MGSADPGQTLKACKGPFIFIYIGGIFMAKVGLADTLKLLSAGYKKKDIDALAAIDEDHTAADQEQKEEVPPKHENQEVKEEEKKEEEPDYKKLYEELKALNDETEKKVTKLQQDNIHKNSAPAAAEAKKNEQDALTNLVRGFM